MGKLDQAKQQLDAALSADRQFAPAYRTWQRFIKLRRMPLTKPKLNACLKRRLN